MSTRLGITVLLLGFLGVAAADAEPLQLTWEDLARRMVDLKHLAKLPEAGETSAVWSSYDRASAYDQTAGRYTTWHANRDGDGYIRQEGDGIVMAEMAGPGVVW